MATRPSPNARLTMQWPQPGAFPHTVTIDHLPFTLGRGSERDLCISSPEISRAHAIIDRDADGYFVRDTGSRHGTFVNGIRITTTRLRSLATQFAQTGSSPRPGAGGPSDLDTLALFLKFAQSLYQRGARADVLSTM